MTSVVLPLNPLAFAAMMFLGGTVALGRPLPVISAVAIAMPPAAVVGWSNGAEVDAQMSAWRFITGLLLVGAMLVAYGVGLLSRFQAPWIRVGCRVLGSWIAATGVLAQSLG